METYLSSIGHPIVVTCPFNSILVDLASRSRIVQGRRLLAGSEFDFNIDLTSVQLVILEVKDALIGFIGQCVDETTGILHSDFTFKVGKGYS